MVNASSLYRNGMSVSRMIYNVRGIFGVGDDRSAVDRLVFFETALMCE